MNLSLKIARRYLFAKKSTNAINIISGITIFGISVGTAALVLVLSVFNGFEDLITGLFGAFNPDVKIVPAKGKVFDVDTLILEEIKNLAGVELVAQSLEEIAFFEYKSSQDFGIIKGVDQYYSQVTSIDSMIREGKYEFTDGVRNLAVLGVGMRNKLSVNVNDYLGAMSVYMPKRKEVGPMSKPFNQKTIYPGGTFVIQQDFDNQYILASLDFVRDLLVYENKVSALEIKLTEGGDDDATIANIKNIVGDGFLVKSRYEQDEAFLKLMNIEKWLSFAILSLTLVLVAFNMIGALWMIVLEKKPDIAILKSMGADNKSIRNIFISEGFLISLFGLLIGFVLAIGFYLAQIFFGIVPIPPGFVVDAYPISIRLPDFILVAITVILIGLVASIPPAIRATRVPALIRND